MIDFNSKFEKFYLIKVDFFSRFCPTSTYMKSTSIKTRLVLQWIRYTKKDSKQPKKARNSLKLCFKMAHNGPNRSKTTSNGNKRYKNFVKRSISIMASRYIFCPNVVDLQRKLNCVAIIWIAIIKMENLIYFSKVVVNILKTEKRPVTWNAVDYEEVQVFWSK